MIVIFRSIFLLFLQLLKSNLSFSVENIKNIVNLVCTKLSCMVTMLMDTALPSVSCSSFCKTKKDTKKKEELLSADGLNDGTVDQS